MKFNKLNQEEKRIIIEKGTELPHTGKFNNHFIKGIYTCRQCNSALFFSETKFQSHCGWPSFDDEISGTIMRIPDPDGKRTEIICSTCKGHLGHVFKKEGYTLKNTRHCVNSVSLNFIPEEQIGQAFFAGGCFWGVEYQFSKKEGVLAVISGFSGGEIENPTYQLVSTHQTKYAETVRIIYDKNKINYEDLVKLFFEIHDFTQIGHQGPDIGEHYRSEIFVMDEKQEKTAKKYIDILSEKGYKVATKISNYKNFYSAEEYHQKYYQRKNSTPYCHIYKKIF